MAAADLLFAAAPILLLVYWMTKKVPMPSVRALPLAAAVAYGVRLVWFETEANVVNATVVEGLLVALTPVSIVFGAVFFFRTMEHCGAMDTIRGWLNHLTDNRVAQVVIIGWSFQFLIEGVSGFGTPAALAAPLLVGLGFPAVRVATACLILNTVPVSFGAVGTPIWFGFGPLGLAPQEMAEVAWKTALVHTAAAGVVPLLAFRLLVGWREIFSNIVFIYLALAASTLPMLAVAFFDVEFPSVVGGLAGLLLTVGAAARGIGLARPDGAGAAPVAAAPSARTVAKALFPIWGTVLVLLVTRLPGLGLRGALTADTPAWDVSLGGLGVFSVSPALVLSLRGIFGTEVDWTHQLLYVPSLIPFVLVSVMAWSVFAAPAGTGTLVWRETIERIRTPFVALLGALVFVGLLMVGAERSSVLLIGGALAESTGGWWEHVASYLGALGAFFSGSATVSNLTFGGIQAAIAAQVGAERTTVLALQSVGGAMGNMVAIHNIVAVCSVLKLNNVEGEILKKTAGPMLLYGAVAAVVALVL